MKTIQPIYFVLLFFFLFKLSHLHIPYFWDELGVYAQAALYMYDNQISMMPKALPPELSRGHPLLCTVIFAIGYRILGPHVWVGHLLALLWSCGLLYMLYRLTREFFGANNAILACTLLAVQPVFIAQSIMVLPEIILAFFCTASLYAYLKQRFVLLALCSSLALLTKETAVIIPVTLSVPVLLTMLHQGYSKTRLIQLGLVNMPLFVWGLFLAIQKIQNGWFFFPLHTGYISFAPSDIISRLGYYVSFLFKGQGRFLWTALIVAAAFVFFIQNRGRAIDFKKYITGQWQPAQLFVFYIIISLIVSALNFHLARYILIVMPVLCCLVAAQITYLFNQLKAPRWLYFAVVPSFLLLPLCYYKGTLFNIDADMGYVDIVAAQQEIISELNQQAPHDAIIAADFPIYHGLLDTRMGYSAFNYSQVTMCGAGSQADYIIYSSFDRCKPDTDTMILIKRVTTPLAYFALYKNIR